MAVMRRGFSAWGMWEWGMLADREEIHNNLASLNESHWAYPYHCREEKLVLSPSLQKKSIQPLLCHQLAYTTFNISPSAALCQRSSDSLPPHLTRHGSLKGRAFEFGIRLGLHRALIWCATSHRKSALQCKRTSIIYWSGLKKHVLP